MSCFISGGVLSHCYFSEIISTYNLNKCVTLVWKIHQIEPAHHGISTALDRYLCLVVCKLRLFTIKITTMTSTIYFLKPN